MSKEELLRRVKKEKCYPGLCPRRGAYEPKKMPGIREINTPYKPKKLPRSRPKLSKINTLYYTGRGRG